MNPSFLPVRRVVLLVLTPLLLAAAGSARAAIAAVRLFPDNGAANVCADTRLKIEFDAPIQRGAKGFVRVFQASDNAEVRTIDVSTSISTKYVGAISLRYFPILFHDREVTIDLGDERLQYGMEYYATVDPGAFTDPSGAPFAGLSGKTSWSFKVKPSAPMIDSELKIAADGSGDFSTIQGAIDRIPSGPRPKQLILRIAPGAYEEQIAVYDKPNLVFLGADRKKTILCYPNSERLNVGSPKRVLLYIESPDVLIANLTLHNTTPYRGGQAEALCTAAERVVVADCDILSYQDTLKLSGRVYMTNCYVEGSVDYVWGLGTAFFHKCEFKTLYKGYIVQARNGEDTLGYFFVNCNLTGTPEAAGTVLARYAIGYPYGNVAYINCTIGDFLNPVGWSVGNIGDPETAKLSIGLWEYRSVDPSGKPIDISRRSPYSQQLTDEQARQLSDPAYVLAGPDRWDPTKVALPKP